MKKQLLIGIGNSGREDDGLGWAFVEQVERENLFRGDCLYRFQLNLEDAELISHFNQVIFVDAHRGELAGGFSLTPCRPQAEAGFSSHLLSPGSTLYLCQQLYNWVPQTWTLAIQGFKWELREGLSPRAQDNLCQALSLFRAFSGRSGVYNL